MVPRSSILVLNSFVSTDKPFLQPNTAVPTTQVEELVFKGNGGVTLKDGEEYLNVTWKEAETCETLNYLSSRDLDEFIYDLMLPYNYELNFSMCDTRDVMEVDLCKSHEELRCIFSQNRFNACEYWTVVKGVSYRKCKLETFTIEAISATFQAESLLSQDDRIPIIADIQNDVPMWDKTLRFHVLTNNILRRMISCDDSLMLVSVVLDMMHYIVEINECLYNCKNYNVIL